MQIFTSRSIPFKKVIQDLAQELNTHFHQDCEEYSLTLPDEYGEGTIKGVNYDEGIGLLQYDCIFKEDTEIHFIIDEIHPLKFMFCELGSFSHRFQDEIAVHQVSDLQNIIVASNHYQGHIIRFNAGERVKINNLEIDRKRFYESRKCVIQKLDEPLFHLFEDVRASGVFYHHGNYSLQTANVFENIGNFDGNSFLRDIFIHSQAYLILYIQILEFKESMLPNEKRSIVLKRELESIHNAAAIIHSDLANFKTVKYLSRQVGINIHKLQNGFKNVYGITVNQYVKEKRIEETIVYLKNTDLTISEIADKVGIKSKSYLSKIFKEKYGRTPIEIRRDLK